MLVMYLGWKLWKRTTIVALHDMDLETDTYTLDTIELPHKDRKNTWTRQVREIWRWIL